jgi:ABC-2 type transport system permease protein
LALRLLWVCYVRVLREYRRVPLSVFVIPLVMPIFIMTIMARVYAEAIVPMAAGSYLSYVIPACVVVAGMLGSGTAGVTTAIERQTGYYDRMRISPGGPGAGHLGRRFADVTRVAMFGALLIVVGWLNGSRIADWPLALLVAASLAGLWAFAYGGFAFSICLRTGSAEISQALIPLFFPVIFMSTAFMPRALLPDGLQAIATYNPISYITTAIRSGIDGHLDVHATAIALAATFGLMLMTQTLVWRATRKVAGG